MSGRVVTTWERAPQDAVDSLGRAGVATVHEAQGRTGLLARRLRPVWSGARVAGTAVTVSIPPADNWMIHVAVEQCGPGDILVVAPTSISDAGYFGELLATSLAARGLRGLIIDAGCRDVAELKEIGFPVWAAHVSAQGAVKETLGDVNLPLVCGGQIVNPGDVITADDDGVCVTPAGLVTEVLGLTEKRLAKEAETRKALASGTLGLDYYGMRDRLVEKGLSYE